jgi:ankyrin repeat protein
MGSRKLGKEAVQLLLYSGASLDLGDKNKRTPLSYAAENMRIVVLQLLLDKGANPNSEDKDKQTPLYWATKNEHGYKERQLDDGGSHTNSEGDSSEDNNDKGIVQLLMNGGGDPGFSDENAPILLGCQRGCVSDSMRPRDK